VDRLFGRERTGSAAAVTYSDFVVISRRPDAVYLVNYDARLTFQLAAGSLLPRPHPPLISWI
jgi:hypothetical protein